MKFLLIIYIWRMDLQTGQGYWSEYNSMPVATIEQCEYYGIQATMNKANRVYECEEI